MSDFLYEKFLEDRRVYHAARAFWFKQIKQLLPNTEPLAQYLAERFENGELFYDGNPIINDPYSEPTQHWHFAGVSPEDISAIDIFTAVCKIRSEKLPDPKIIGNVGSFFQNPIISNEQLDSLKREYPQIVSYPENSTHSKLAAGWLVDQCGFKGLQKGHVGVHSKQALVLTHDGGGDASELLRLANEIQEAVNKRFGVSLEIEPNIFS